MASLSAFRFSSTLAAMPTRARTAKPPAPSDPDKLKRETAGRYVTDDERFTVEQGSNGWTVQDAEQTDDFGLPLVRGPFPTLEAAREGIAAARAGPTPMSDLAERPRPDPAGASSAGAASRKDRGARATATAEPAEPPEPAPPPTPLVDIRPFRQADGEGLRALWATVGFRTVGDDDEGLRTFAKRNPGTFLVAHQAEAIVGSAMGGWDGRRGWIYHVATSPEVRRTGLATRLVQDVEARLAALGARRVDLLVRDGNQAGAKFWRSLGYEATTATQYVKDLKPAPDGTDTADD
jgi:ribosomal protein S18 acetylase RimI-like enzyme